jgi:Tol biopolymer transport system component
LTSGPILWDPPIPGKDGKKIFVGGDTPRGELTRIDPKTGAPQTFLDGISAEFVSFSPDGKFVAYVAFPEGTLWKANRDGSNRMRLTQQPDLAVNPRWSPDSQEIVYTLARDGRSTIRRISALDGAPLWLMAEEPGEMHDSNWSPDGKKVLFCMGPSGWLGEAKRDLRIANLETRQVTILPGSDGFWSPRWSPDGRYMTALPRAQGNGLPVYDFTTRHWHVVPISGKTDFPTFSRDSRFIYFLRYGRDMGMFRVPVAGGKVERVVDLTNWHFTGFFEYSASLDPTDAPLVLRDTGSDDLYALTLEQK